MGGLHLGSVLNFYVAADDFFYGTHSDAAALPGATKTQKDGQLAFGFGVPLGR